MFYKTLARYGDVLQPLVLTDLHPLLQAQLAASPRLMAWVRLADEVHRAEKISSWTEWTPEEQAAYNDTDNPTAFSRLRGYTDDEIDAFERYMAETLALCAEFGEDEICSIEFEIGRATATSASEHVAEEIEALSVAGRRPARRLSP